MTGQATDHTAAIGRRLRPLLVKLGLAAAASSALWSVPGLSQQRLAIAVLSSPRPDLVSGGDALVEVRAAGPTVELSVNGAPSRALRRDEQRRSLVGLVTGLKPGRNELVARSGKAVARLIVTNHSKDGPIFSGPHIWPHECKTKEAGLGDALDAMCNAQTRVERFYRSTDGSFKALPAGTRPADLKLTTTLDGRTVPYIVRVESGTLNRSIYRIAVLDDLDRPDQAWVPGAGWNRRLAVFFDGGLAGRYEQGFSRPAAILNDLYLSRGFAVMNSSFLVNGRVSNAILQGETLMMLKEHFIERYGVPRWTAGTGGSGGAIQQIHITALYPGLLDGLQTQVGFADSQVATHVLDCDLLQNYWRKPGLRNWTDAEKAAVSGYASAATCHYWQRLISGSLKANNKPACGLSDQSLIYDPRTNPKGVRCGLYPLLVNQLGRDRKTGVPLSPYDNVGVQYGLAALNGGKISVDDFLDLNAGIGGSTVDGDYSSARSVASPVAMRRLYASGLVNAGGGGLATTPILSYRNYQDPFGDFHDRQRDFEVRLRMVRANGDAANHVIWVGPQGRGFTQPSPVTLDVKALDTMTAWLDAITADPAPLSHAKVVRLKPAEAVDAWFDANGDKHVAQATLDPTSEFNKRYPIYGNPRIAAGGPQTNDILRCRLKRVNAADYRVTFTDRQLQRLRAIFPTGVCDFRKPGVGQVGQVKTFQPYAAVPR